ncbi:tyrosine-protein phosphatase [Sphingomonas sp. MJ1 (PH-R8)]|uniref:tyrosine-protein phosphatase n=1 Tax=Sphingomonas sp. MJ1 (PH-R8) TaxID=3112950 RepID=UPI003A88A2BA
MDIHRRGFLGGASAAAAAAMMHGAAPASAAVQRLAAGGRWTQSFRPPLGLGLGGEAVFQVIDAHPGGARGYLRDRLGLGDAELRALRQRYTA